MYEGTANIAKRSTQKALSKLEYLISYEAIIKYSRSYIFEV